MTTNEHGDVLVEQARQAKLVIAALRHALDRAIQSRAITDTAYGFASGTIVCAEFAIDLGARHIEAGVRHARPLSKQDHAEAAEAEVRA